MQALDVESIPSAELGLGPGAMAYHQRNIKLSRKQLMPLIVQALGNEATA